MTKIIKESRRERYDLRLPTRLKEDLEAVAKKSRKSMNDVMIDALESLFDPLTREAAIARRLELLDNRIEGVAAMVYALAELTLTPDQMSQLLVRAQKIDREHLLEVTTGIRRFGPEEFFTREIPDRKE